MTIAEALTAELARQGVTVYKLAKASEMPASRVHDILNGVTGNPGVLTLQRLLAALGKSLAWLERQTK